MSSVKNITASVYINDKTGGKTLRELRAESKKLNNELANMAIHTEDFRNKASRLKEVKSEIGQINNQIHGTSFSWRKAADGFNKYFGVVTLGLAALTGVVKTFKSWVDGFTTLADAQADVAKTTGFTNTQIEQLMESLKGLNTRTTRTELLKLAEEAGRLGKDTVPEVLEFVKVADQLKVALGDDLGGDEAIREVGKLTEVYKVGEKTGSAFGEAMLKLGSSINEVSASGANQAGFLVDYLKRMAGISTQTTLTAEQQIGFAATFDETGQQVETSATAMSQVITNMYKDTATYANIAGMSTEDFSQLLKTDTNAALVAFLKGLNGNNEGLQIMAQKMQDLGLDGTRVVATLSAVAGNLELLEVRQRQASEALIEGTSLTDEFNRKNQNFAANMERIGKAFYGAFVNSSLMRGLEKLSQTMVEIVNVPLSETIEKERIELRKMEIQLTDTNTPLDTRKQIIETLMAKYPGYFSMMNVDTTTNNELQTAISQVNDQLIKKVALLETEELIQKKKAQIDEQTLNAERRKEQLALKLIKLQEEYNLNISKGRTLTEKVEFAIFQLKGKESKLFAPPSVDLQRALNQYNGALEKIDYSTDRMEDLQSRLDKLSEVFGTTTKEIDGNLAGGKTDEDGTKTDNPNESSFVGTEEKDQLQKAADERKKAEEQIQKFLEGLEKDELKRLENKYAQIIELAKKHNLDINELQSQYEKERQALEYSQLEESVHAEQARKMELMENSFRQLIDFEQNQLQQQTEFRALSQEQQNMKLLEIEISFLTELLEARKAMGEETLTIEKEIAEKREKILNKSTKKKEDADEKQAQSAFAAAGRIGQAERDKTNAIEGAGARALGEARLAVKASLMEALGSALASVFKALPFPINILVASGTGALVSSLFDSILPASFADGGFTTGQGIADPKIPGRRITGYVHDNEYVVDTATMYEPDVWPLIKYIEARRTGQIQGFADGGFSSQPQQPKSDQAAVTNFSELGALMRVMIGKLDEIKSEMGKPNLALLDNEQARKLRQRIDNEVEMENRSFL